MTENEQPIEKKESPKKKMSIMHKIIGAVVVIGVIVGVKYIKKDSKSSEIHGIMKSHFEKLKIGKENLNYTLSKFDEIHDMAFDKTYKISTSTKFKAKFNFNEYQAIVYNELSKQSGDDKKSQLGIIYKLMWADAAKKAENDKK
jgi:hypothetical protein